MRNGSIESNGITSKAQTPDNQDELLVLEDDRADAIDAAPQPDPWKILIVDDEPAVHQVTKLALKGFTFANRPLTFISAFDTPQTKAALNDHPDINLILLDVVMEEKDSGLTLIKYIRDDLQNNLVRIILRTGQPGEAPEESVIVNYAVNAYKTKNELTRRKLFATLVTGLRSYNDLMTIETNRRKLEALQVELQARNKALVAAKETAERANRVKRDFLRVINHELRTPLNVILGMCSLLRDEIVGPLGEEQAESVASIENSGHHLLGLIEDILDFSTIQANTLKLSIAPVSVSGVCREALRLSRQLARQKNIRVSFKADRLGATLEADELRLKQILLNLLDNAIKFTPQNGWIGLDVKCDDQRQQIRFSVWDTGTGIDPQKLNDLFEPFTLGQDILTRKEGGAGLGLSLAARLTEMHQGHISVRSSPGKGSIFTVTLPQKAQILPDAETEALLEQLR
ncbi:MAG: response regulator [Chloroflexi bacterium]|nr:MAG: response regulator [Chloroflexota bacterium]